MQLSSDDFSATVQALAGKSSISPGNKRRDPRVSVDGSVTVIALIQTDATNSPQKIQALARDLSPSGIGLLQTKPVATGQELVVELPRVRKSPLFLTCRVMHNSSPADGIYSLGLQFCGVCSQELVDIMLSSARTPA